MDASLPVAVPWIVLGVVLVALACLAGGLLVRRPARPGEDPAAEPAAATSSPAPSAFAEDDLPGFRDHPPGTPGAPAARDGGPPPETALPAAPGLPAGRAPSAGRAVAAMAAV
ncbi:MAG TPA: hypothetical protein VHF92_04220, partial [Geodermatophilus sp.]|nr:hypothetical protein [Geodermatophilus sp.]